MDNRTQRQKRAQSERQKGQQADRHLGYHLGAAVEQFELRFGDSERPGQVGGLFENQAVGKGEITSRSPSGSSMSRMPSSTF